MHALNFSNVQPIPTFLKDRSFFNKRVLTANPDVCVLVIMHSLSKLSYE